MVKAGGKDRATDPDRKPLLDADGKRINIERPATFARSTLVIDRDGKLVSQRANVNTATDAEDVAKIVSSLNQD